MTRLSQIRAEALRALRRIYYDAERPAAFTSNVQQLRSEASKEGVDVSANEVKLFLSSEPNVSITRANRRRFPRVPVYAREVDATWAAGESRGFVRVRRIADSRVESLFRFLLLARVEAAQSRSGRRGGLRRRP